MIDEKHNRTISIISVLEKAFIEAKHIYDDQLLVEFTRRHGVLDNWRHFSDVIQKTATGFALKLAPQEMQQKYVVEQVERINKIYDRLMLSKHRLKIDLFADNKFSIGTTLAPSVFSPATLGLETVASIFASTSAMLIDNRRAKRMTSVLTAIEAESDLNISRIRSAYSLELGIYKANFNAKRNSYFPFDEISETTKRALQTVGQINASLRSAYFYLHYGLSNQLTDFLFDLCKLYCHATLKNGFDATCKTRRNINDLLNGSYSRFDFRNYTNAERFLGYSLYHRVRKTQNIAGASGQEMIDSYIFRGADLKVFRYISEIDDYLTNKIEGQGITSDNREEAFKKAFNTIDNECIGSFIKELIFCDCESKKRYLIMLPIKLAKCSEEFIDTDSDYDKRYRDM